MRRTVPWREGAGRSAPRSASWALPPRSGARPTAGMVVANLRRTLKAVKRGISKTHCDFPLSVFTAPPAPRLWPRTLREIGAAPKSRGIPSRISAEIVPTHPMQALDSTELRPRRATRGARWIWFCIEQGSGGIQHSGNRGATASGLRRDRTWRGRKERPGSSRSGFHPTRVTRRAMCPSKGRAQWVSDAAVWTPSVTMLVVRGGVRVHGVVGWSGVMASGEENR
jgi:hypothetical protein